MDGSIFNTLVFINHMLWGNDALFREVIRIRNTLENKEKHDRKGNAHEACLENGLSADFQLLAKDNGD